MPSVTVATASAVNDSLLGTQSWSNVSNVTSSNDSRATALLANNVLSNIIRCTPASLSAIPASATIDGIVINIEKSSTVSSTVIDNTVRLYRGGTYTGTNKSKAGAWGTTDASSSYGGAADLWGLSWTRTQVVTDLAVGIAAYNPAASTSTARLDYVEFTIHYTLQQNISAPLLSVPVTFFGPTATVQGFTAPFLLVEPVFFDHAFAFIQTLEAPLLSVEPVFFEIRTAEGISVPFVEFPVTFFGPALAFPQELDCPHLSVPLTLYGFTVFNTWENTDSVNPGVWVDVDIPN